MVSKQQINIFKTSADKIFQLKDYTSATILYFKTWFAIHDFILLNKIGYAPKDHTERFKLLKEEFPEEVMDTINKILNMQKYLYSYLNFSQEESKKILMNQEEQNKKIDELKNQVKEISENKYLDERFDYLEERFTSVLSLLKEENKILKDQNVILQKLTK